MEEFPSAFVQVKVEPVEDEEYDPSANLNVLRNENSSNHRGHILMEDEDELENELEILDVSSMLNPIRQRRPRILHPGQQRFQEMNQLRAELSHANQIISDQSVQLEKAEKKIDEQQGQLIRQEELLLRTEADRHTDKAVAEAEIVTLRQLLGQERKRRIFTLHRDEKMGVVRRSNYGHAIRQKLTAGTRVDNLGNKLVYGTQSSRNLANFEGKMGYRSAGRPAAVEAEQTFRYKPGGNAGGIKYNENDRNVRNDTGDDVEVINIIESGQDIRKRQWRSQSVPISTTTSGTVVGAPNNEDLTNRSSYLFPCTICGAAFNEGWKLVRHTQLYHRRPRNDSNFESVPTATTSRNISAGTMRVPVGIIRGGGLGPSMRMRRRPARVTFASLPNTTRGRIPSSGSFSQPPTRRGPKPHLDRVDLNKKFVCVVCSCRFFIVSLLKTHMTQAHGIIDDTFAIGCRDCGRIFSSRKQHVRHRRLVHGTQYSAKSDGRVDQTRQISDLEPNSSQEPSSSSANAAGATGTTSTVNSSIAMDTFRLLQGQLRSAISGIPNENANFGAANVEHAVDRNRARMGCYCICGRSFRTPLTLKEHIRHNTTTQGNSSLNPPSKLVGSEDFPSEIVTNPIGKLPVENSGTAVTTASSKTSKQESHQLVGADPKVYNTKYPCSCGRVYGSRSSFFTHVRCKNKGKIFMCSLCPRRFDLHGKLKQHVQSAHKTNYGQGRYGCGSCAQTFDSSAMLTRHRFFLCKYRNNNRKQRHRNTV